MFTLNNVQAKDVQLVHTFYINSKIMQSYKLNPIDFGLFMLYILFINDFIKHI